MAMKFSTNFFFFLFSVSLVALASCSKEDQVDIDQQLIEDFITEQNLDADSTSSGLYYVIYEPGSADHPTVSDQVTVSYVGFLLDGTVFDAGTNVTFPLNQVISGWQEGIPLFGKGGRGLLIIPSHLAYGDRPVSGIPPNSVLVFEVELVDF